MKAAIVTVAAAASSGAAAGLLLREQTKNAETVKIKPLTQPVQRVPSPVANQADLQAQLASLRAENSRLNIRLSATQSELDLARRMPSNASQENDDAWRLQLEEANNTAASLGAEVEILQGLVSLYEQLDEIDLPAIVGSGLSTVEGAFDGLMTEIPTVREGIEIGQQALSELEEQLPVIEESRRWLNERFKVLAGAYGAVEQALRKALEATDSFLHLLERWFQDMLRWLPFGIGDKALNIMQVLSVLLGEIPETIDGFENKVAGTLDLWLAEEEGQPRLQRRLIKPVRENALDKASTTINQVETLQSIFQNNLNDPVIYADNQRKLILERINQYRELYQL